MHEMNTQSAESYMTAAEVCDFLRITDRTLYRYQQSHRLTPLLLPGGHRRFRRSDVEQLLAAS